ncbi:type II toxin-antitoxin system RelE/ParE family toxin [Streptococcus equi]|uniref:Plasmid addiction system poison protein n=2 Tax=Streptococcus TaxID=1301 RepID=A0A922NSC8_9STRE|nr:type II toxin-antitoxin system mRNA interferase toxin, RelE/StbE family [Streptococcus equi subsp. equi]KED03455.1 plasmid addiction system poison protein [Streptococcus equi subsp. ruminatorum CECT 5772]NBK43913.1 type II toxin-antitoxin system RelE/ParE family toxin [Streptococcus equi]NBK45903.1 type II toxin-antitoxin system RelE/ParE family toxin [Streptococcus equi]NBK50314.1 type II toxin-antitoxin system RelE/ParE family toxin [Streptococcus equi]
MMYKIEFDPKVKKQLKKLDKTASSKIIRWLYANVDGTSLPRLHGKALTGDLAGLWRYRIGDYRVICDIQDDKLVILAVHIAHRKQVYKLKLPNNKR